MTRLVFVHFFVHYIIVFMSFVYLYIHEEKKNRYVQHVLIGISSVESLTSRW